MLPLIQGKLLWSPAILGWGLLTWSAWIGDRHRTSEFYEPGVLGLIGFLAISLLGLFLHFFIPLGEEVAVGVWALGCLALLKYRKEVKRLVDWPSFSIFLLVIFATSYLPFGGPISDMAYYHLQAIKWNAEYPLSFGLTNLNPQLGYNSAWFVTNAMMKLPFIGWECVCSANNILFAFFAVALYRPLQRLGTSLVPGARYFSHAFCFLNLMCVLWAFRLFPAFNFTSSDFASYAYDVYVWYLLLRAWEEREDAGAVLSKLVIGFAMFATIIKLSYCVALLAAAIAVLAVQSGNGAGLWPLSVPRLRSLLKVSALGIFLLAAWMGSGLFISGCFVYPMKLTCVDALPWTAPNAAALDTRLIEGFARDNVHRGTVSLEGWDWLRGWWAQWRFFFVFRLAVIAFVAGIGICLVFVKRRLATPVSRTAVQTFAVAFLVNLLALAVWLKTAPLPRYAFGYFLSASALAISAGLFTANVGGLILQRAKLLVVGSAVTILMIFVLHLIRAPQSSFAQWKAWPNFEKVTIREITSGQGEKIYVGSDGLCWDVPLPCTPTANDLDIDFSKLTLRRTNLGRIMFSSRAEIRFQP